MTASEERIAMLRVEAARRRELYKHAERELYLARAALAEAEGDGFQAQWLRALAGGDYDAAHRCYLEDQARSVLSGRGTYGDLTEATKKEILAEVERLRSEGQGAQP